MGISSSARVISILNSLRRFLSVQTRNIRICRNSLDIRLMF